MNALKFLLIALLLFCGGVAGLFWHYSVDPTLGGFALLHAFNIGGGAFLIGRIICAGIQFGWKS